MLKHLFSQFTIHGLLGCIVTASVSILMRDEICEKRVLYVKIQFIQTYFVKGPEGKIIVE